MQAEEAAGWLCAEGWDARIVDDPKTLDAGAADVVVQSENQVAFTETNTWVVRARTLIDILAR